LEPQEAKQFKAAKILKHFPNKNCAAKKKTFITDFINISSALNYAEQ